MASPLLASLRSSTLGRCRNKQSFLGRVSLRIRAESPLIEEGAGRRIRSSMPPVFNRTRWSYHQDTGRYSRHLKSIFRSVTFRNLQAPLSFLTLVSCLVVLYRTLIEMEQLPDLFEGIRFTDVPFQLTSFALSLLLVFRTDASYGRWCAAMDAWGTLRASTSQLIRKATAWVSEPAALQRLVRWMGAFPLCLMVELRHDQGDPGVEAALRAELRQVLRPHEVEQVIASGPYYHQFCLSVLTALIEATQLGESRETAMLEDLNGYNQAACECEKIMRFPIPLTYTRHTSRFMLIYLAALPLALYDSCDWAVVPVTLVIAFLLLGIEDIGVQIEEPFSILPLPDICADLRVTAERAVVQRSMVRCLADPDTCTFDPEDLLRPAGRRAATTATAAAGAGVGVGAAATATATANTSNGNGNGSSNGSGASSSTRGWTGSGADGGVEASLAAEILGEDGPRGEELGAPAWVGEDDSVLVGSGVGGRGDGGGNGNGASAGGGRAAPVSASSGAGSGAAGIAGRGTYIYSKGKGLVAAVADGNGVSHNGHNGHNGHSHGNGAGMMSGSSVPHHPHR